MSNSLLGKILLGEDLYGKEAEIYQNFLEEKKRLDKLHKTTKESKKNKK